MSWIKKGSLRRWVNNCFRGRCFLDESLEGVGAFARMLQYNPKLKNSARSLRANLTDAEQRLWARLRRKQILGVQFYRQKPIGNYIVDFYVPAARLVLEIDGSQHLELAQAAYDRRRTDDLKQMGLRVLRYSDRQVLLELDSVIERIFQAVEVKIPLNPPFGKGGFSLPPLVVTLHPADSHHRVGFRLGVWPAQRCTVDLKKPRRIESSPILFDPSVTLWLWDHLITFT
jgi:very-short-patch-repair endonuclease